MNKDIIKILSSFKIPEKKYSVRKIDTGHINDTFMVMEDQDYNPAYVLQKINKMVFPDPASVCDNSARVLSYIDKKVKQEADINYVAIKQYKKKGGINYYIDDNGDYWRLISFVNNSVSYNNTTDPVIAREAGRIVADFQRLIKEVGSELHITIPAFHDYNRRMDEFTEAAGKDKNNRNQAAYELIKKAEKYAIEMEKYFNRLQDKNIPERGIHNDTKLNNVLFDKHKNAICLIDLDTVMPGYVHYDFGDAIRTLANIAREDEFDVNRIKFGKSNFENFTKGYMSSAKKFLTIDEIELLAFSPLYMTYIIGLRFLTDYMNGDIYFHTEYSDHNRIRARNQFKYLELLEKSSDLLQKTIDMQLNIS